MNNLVRDPMFVYAVAFAIFAMLAFKYARKPLLGWLDSEIIKIRTELDQATQLRAEAEAALADIRTRQNQAEKDAVAIIKLAEQQAEDMRKHAETELAASMERQQNLAAERIRIAESEATADVRKMAIELASEIARKNIAEKLSDADAKRLVSEAIASLPKQKKTKAA